MPLRNVWIRAVMALAMLPATVGDAPAERFLAPPMRLGAELPIASEPVLPNRKTVVSCRALRRTAERLGETWAGTRFRRNVLSRTCGLTGSDSAERHWQWPWAGKGLDGALPEREHARHGLWSIHCETSARRERCALSQTGTLLPAAGPGTPAIRFVTHFVIDSIAGQERVLWRIFVGDPKAATARLEVEGETLLSRERFDTCGRKGCLLEADVEAGATAIDRLWSGQAVFLGLPVEGKMLTGEIAAAGLRKGLSELTSLRRRERGKLAGQ